MNGWSLTPTQVVGGLAVLVVALWLWRAAARRARAAVNAARTGVRLFSLAGRTVSVAVVISGAQWLALTHPHCPVVVKVATLLMPALFASWVLVRALTVTTVDPFTDGRGRRGRRGGGRR
ncbi:hypothetical protein [Actinokineospora inagensis]|uniref:hypothetical protein n=1 Tax=Actinokineospora inagensis TaxID=103730 RepID=UPI0004103ABC|nr:hypothetical protein [Actinokineospora inagensis]